MTLRPTIAAFGMIDGQLAVGGIPLKRLAERVGSTPFFAYDRKLLTGRVELLKSILPKQIKLSYAVKANPMPAVVQHLATLVDCFDVASALEMRTALDTSIRADKVSFAGPGKTEAEILQASLRASPSRWSRPRRRRVLYGPVTDWGYARAWQSG